MKNQVFPYLRNFNAKSRIVVLSGAGVSQESGLATFRDNDGLWEEYNVHEVATPEAWLKNPEMVQGFYNARRKQMLGVSPNLAHEYLARLEDQFEVCIITQNVDDLHERAGSRNVIHLHGELRKCRSTLDSRLVYEVDGWELSMEDKCDLGGVLRPHVVWFGEEVPLMEEALSIVRKSDVLIVVGTSLSVYPAAGLVGEVAPGVAVFVIDPSEVNLARYNKVCHIREKATVGVKNLVLKMLDY